MVKREGMTETTLIPTGAWVVLLYDIYDQYIAGASYSQLKGMHVGVVNKRLPNGKYKQVIETEVKPL